MTKSNGTLGWASSATATSLPAVCGSDGSKKDVGSFTGSSEATALKRSSLTWLRRSSRVLFDATTDSDDASP